MLFNIRPISRVGFCIVVSLSQVEMAVRVLQLSTVYKEACKLHGVEPESYLGRDHK
jgi:hypothetical protein